jgi:undecaprenyl diphosphate synthase
MQNPVVMLIPDGNIRWSRANNKTLKEGYDLCGEILALFYDKLFGKVSSLYIPVCTVNNLKNRPAEQIPWYLDCFTQAIELSQCPIRLEVVGDISAIPKPYQRKYRDLEVRYNDPGGLHILYTVGWSSDVEVLKLCQESAKNPPQSMEDVRRMSVIAKPVDLIIRTGKVQRLSAMAPLFSPYAELYFINKYFQDTSADDIEVALADYYSRERRFGGDSR